MDKDVSLDEIVEIATKLVKTGRLELINTRAIRYEFTSFDFEIQMWNTIEDDELTIIYKNELLYRETKYEKHIKKANPKRIINDKIYDKELLENLYINLAKRLLLKS